MVSFIYTVVQTENLREKPHRSIRFAIVNFITVSVRGPWLVNPYNFTYPVPCMSLAWIQASVSALKVPKFESYVIQILQTENLVIQKLNISSHVWYIIYNGPMAPNLVPVTKDLDVMELMKGL